jgi:hypothetical protein
MKQGKVTLTMRMRMGEAITQMAGKYYSDDEDEGITQTTAVKRQ